MRLQMSLNITIPKVPNFLLEKDGDGKYSIAIFSEDDLRAIGDAWTDNLILRAGELRSNNE